MLGIINKFKIPTILGLALILAGITAGVFLVLKDQIFLTQASPNLLPQNVTVSNITESEVTLSWQTSQPTISFVTFYTKGSGEQNALDDKDNLKPKPDALHYTTVKNLQPDTDYSFKIISGKLTSEGQTFKTAKSASSQNGFGPVRGTVFDGEKPLETGIIYLSVSNATTESAQITNLGNFLIPISYMRKEDLSDTFVPTGDTLAKLTIVSDKGSATALFKLSMAGIELPPIHLGQNIDLTTATPKPNEQSSPLSKFDLNGDGKINSNDNAILLQNFGKNPKNKKADLNGDGIVDQKDLELMSKQINQ